jgi:hypothetical protein
MRSLSLSPPPAPYPRPLWRFADPFCNIVIAPVQRFYYLLLESVVLARVIPSYVHHSYAEASRPVLRIRDPVPPFGPLDPGSEIGLLRIPTLGLDPGSKTHIFESFMTIFWEKNPWIVICSKIKKISICAFKKSKKPNFFLPFLLLLLVSESDPGWIKIRIRDPEQTSRIRSTGQGHYFYVRYHMVGKIVLIAYLLFIVQSL